MGLTSEQVQIIKATVPIVKEYGNTITTAFYENLLTENPDLNSIFNTANQLNGHQATALANALYAYAANIDNLAALGPFVERVCMKHASLYVTRDQYDIVGTYLLAAMKQVLGDALTDEIHDAWAAAYNQLADLMATREEQLVSTTPAWKTWRDFRIARKIPESNEITSFYLSPVDGQPLPSFRPGQYISVKTDVPALKYEQARQYSLSDRPRQDHYRISVKKEQGLDPHDPSATAHPGYISNILHDLKKEGDIIQVSHPYGDFYLTDQRANTPIVLISAGVGITPMISILNAVTAAPTPTSSTSSSTTTSSRPSPSSSTTSLLYPSRPTRPIHLIHATRTTPHQPFRPHIQSLASAYPNLRATFFNKSPLSSDVEGADYHHVGRMDLDKLRNNSTYGRGGGGMDPLFLDDKTTEYYVCGPESFMRDVKEKLVKGYGVGEERVRLEVFGTGGV